MIDLKLIREKSNWVEKKIQSKGVKIDLSEILKLDQAHRVDLKKLEDLQALKNKATKQIAQANVQDKKKIIADLQTLDQDVDRLTARTKELSAQLENLLYQIPNLPADDVKIGRDETENEEIRKVGVWEKQNFKIKDHLSLGEALDVIDTKRAAKAVGSRFGYLKNGGALLELALVNYAFEILRPHGFQPIIPPVLLRAESLRGMGYLEHGGEQETYHLSKDDLYLIGTAEQAIGPMHADEIFTEAELPCRYVGYSPCFRREAGAYGKDTRGIFRVHQFEKVEMFSFTRPDQSDGEQEFFLALEEKMMQGLGLPYRVVKICTGDLGAPAARKYDLEVWLPSENRYRETHSNSNTTDFQARRLKIRYQRKGGKNEFVHTVNGTALAIGRTIIAILENYQQADGSVVIPEVLQPSIPGLKRLERPNGRDYVSTSS